MLHWKLLVNDVHRRRIGWKIRNSGSEFCSSYILSFSKKIVKIKKKIKRKKRKNLFKGLLTLKFLRLWIWKFKWNEKVKATVVIQDLDRYGCYCAHANSYKASKNCHKTSRRIPFFNDVTDGPAPDERVSCAIVGHINDK